MNVSVLSLDTFFLCRR